MNDNAATWDAARVNLNPGATVTSRTGRVYAVLGSDERAITLQRESGKTVRITRSKVEKTAARLLAGEVIPVRGVDYTVAIEEGTIAALGDLVELGEEGYRLAD